MRGDGGAGAHAGVFVLDDHELVRAGLASLLREAGIACVGESGSAREAARRIPALRPAVAVLDGRLPDGAGAEVCRAVLAVDPAIRCLLMADGDEEAVLIEAVAAGACGCLSKQDDGGEMVRLVRRAMGGRSAFSPLFRAMLLRAPAEDLAPDPRLRGLSPRELRVLLLIGDGMSNREIAVALALAEKTVKNMTSTVLRKLEVQRRSQAAVLIAGELDRRPPTARTDRLGLPSAMSGPVTSALLDCVSEAHGPGPRGRAERADRLTRALDARPARPA